LYFSKCFLFRSLHASTFFQTVERAQEQIAASAELAAKLKAEAENAETAAKSATLEHAKLQAQALAAEEEAVRAAKELERISKGVSAGTDSASASGGVNTGACASVGSSTVNNASPKGLTKGRKRSAAATGPATAAAGNGAGVDDGDFTRDGTAPKRLSLVATRGDAGKARGGASSVADASSATDSARAIMPPPPRPSSLPGHNNNASATSPTSSPLPSVKRGRDQGAPLLRLSLGGGYGSPGAAGSWARRKTAAANVSFKKELETYNHVKRNNVQSLLGLFFSLSCIVLSDSICYADS